MSAILMYATATVNARTIFTCDACRAQAPGGTAAIVVEDDKIGRPTLTFDQRAARNVGGNLMPVGWAVYGAGHHKCPNCVT